jgi:aryl-alcohol dehydrogenase-like predicted oxidoreductase
VVAPRITLAGTDVARIGLGTNRLTRTREHVELIREAVAAGIGYVDTAHLYVRGDSEETIGEALSPDATGVVVGTKGGFAPGTGSPAQLRAQLEESLQRLRVKSIQLYYLHRVDPETPLETSVGALAEHVERGQIRHVGLSEVTVEQIERARELVPVAAVQNRYNLSDRHWDDVVDHCEREGIVFVPFYPLRGGGGRVLAEIAERHGATPTQIALAWLLKRSPAMLPIPGTLSLEHLKENLAALEIELSDAEFDSLR